MQYAYAYSGHSKKKETSPNLRGFCSVKPLIRRDKRRHFTNTKKDKMHFMYGDANVNRRQTE